MNITNLLCNIRVISQLVRRAIDALLAVVVLCIFSPVMLFTALTILLTSPGPAIYWSNRVGQHNRIFKMPKFRTMRVDTP
ncbi:MAG: sugar transferase, partial [Akkermansiaceae bacterium]|nr:sugar transferase [Akkermansiaceae bacterium]